MVIIFSTINHHILCRAILFPFQLYFYLTLTPGARELIKCFSLKDLSFLPALCSSMNVSCKGWQNEKILKWNLIKQSKQ